MCVSIHRIAYRKEILMRACLEPQLADLSLHAALTQKEKISDGRVVVWYADLFVHAIQVLSYLWRKRKKRKKNKVEIFTFDFLVCEKNYWNSGGIFHIRITKGFHLQDFRITLLWLAWSCFYTLCTGHLLNRPIPTWEVLLYFLIHYLHIYKEVYKNLYHVNASEHLYTDMCSSYGMRLSVVPLSCYPFI